MEIILELVFGFLLEVVLDLFGEALFALGPDRDRAAKLAVKQRHPATIALGYACIGFFFGVMSLLVWRRRVAVGPFGLVSLFASPVIIGTLMLGFGNWRRMNGKTTTSIATFWGGASFAFGFAIVRFALAY